MTRMATTPLTKSDTATVAVVINAVSDTVNRLVCVPSFDDAEYNIKTDLCESITVMNIALSMAANDVVASETHRFDIST